MTQLQVGWSEVVSPLRNAMGFIDHDQRHFALLQRCQVLRVPKALGRQQYDVVRARNDLQLLRLLIRRCNGGVQARCFDVRRFQMLDLIVHQRDQRRDHDHSTA